MEHDNEEMLKAVGPIPFGMEGWNREILLHNGSTNAWRNRKKFQSFCLDND